MGMVNWRAEAAVGVLWRLWCWFRGWFRCPRALAVPSHLWGIRATAGAALPTEAPATLPAPTLACGGRSVRAVVRAREREQGWRPVARGQMHPWKS